MVDKTWVLVSSTSLCAWWQLGYDLSQTDLGDQLLLLKYMGFDFPAKIYTFPIDHPSTKDMRNFNVFLTKSST